MKKITILLFVFIFTLVVSACSKNESILEGSLEDILADIYESDELSDSFKEFIEGVHTIEIEDDRIEYHLGKSNIKFKEAIASVPVMSTSAYELTLIRAKPRQDIEKLKKDIKENVDPQKWVCVGVEKENVIVDNIGDVVILIMSDNEPENLLNAFLSLHDE